MIRSRIVLVSYSVEILPFFLRAKGLAMVYLTVTVSLIFSQYVSIFGSVLFWVGCL